jgi:hypothetical protein
MVPEEAMRSDAAASIQPFLSEGGPEERMNTQRIHTSEEELALMPVTDFFSAMENFGAPESPGWSSADKGLPGLDSQEEISLSFPFLAFDDEDEDDDVEDDEDNFDDMEDDFDDDFEDDDDDFEDDDDDFEDDDEDDDYDYEDDADYDDDFEE